MSLREIAKIRELQEKVAKLEMQVNILMDVHNEFYDKQLSDKKKEHRIGKKKENR